MGDIARAQMPAMMRDGDHGGNNANMGPIAPRLIAGKIHVLSLVHLLSMADQS